MIEAAGWKENQPNRKIAVFEAEWDGTTLRPGEDMRPASTLIRNFGECPERLVREIEAHYRKLKEAISTGKHLDSYFKDTKKWSDVWNKAIANGVVVTLPAVFHGHLAVSGSAKLDAPALTKVGGYLAVSGSAKLDAPALTEVGGYLAVSGSAPALTKVGGYLAVYGSAKLDALTEVGGHLAVYGSAKLDAPALTEVGGHLAVYDSAKLDALALTEVGGKPYKLQT